MQSPIVPTTALGAANRDDMSLNLNLNLHYKVSKVQNFMIELLKCS